MGSVRRRCWFNLESSKVATMSSRKYAPSWALTGRRSALRGASLSTPVSASRLDVWLAAHFADLMEPMELIDAGPDELVVFFVMALFHTLTRC